MEECKHLCLSRTSRWSGHNDFIQVSVSFLRLRWILTLDKIDLAIIDKKFQIFGTVKRGVVRSGDERPSLHKHVCECVSV